MLKLKNTNAPRIYAKYSFDVARMIMGRKTIEESIAKNNIQNDRHNADQDVRFHLTKWATPCRQPEPLHFS